MPISWIRENLAGAWAVMNGDSAGLTRLDTSIEGFWKSFGAIVLVLAFSLPVLLAEPALLAENATGEPPAAGPTALRFVAVAVDWVAFPLLFALLARPLGLASQFVPYIACRNWSSVIVAGVYGAVLLPYVAGLLPAAVVPYLLFAVFGLALRFSYMVARTALGVPAGLAIPIVILEVLVSLVVEFTIGRVG